MSISGSPDSQDKQTAAPEVLPEPSRRRQFVLLLMATAVLLIVGFIGVQLFGIVYGLVFPPDAPVPEDVVMIEHENYAYGVDEWLYGTQTAACDVITFYLESGANCRITPGHCGTGLTNPSTQTVQNVATCTDTIAFSIFEMSWETTIATGYRTGEPTRFRIHREVYWIGTAPSGDRPD